MQKLKSIGCMIFCGSQTIGNMLAGFEPDRILEISEEIVNQNAYHFIKNYPNIPVITPNTWENDEYLNGLKKENYDLLYANNPCSGLSSLVKTASVDNPTNIHFYRVTNAISKIQPKVFFMENAPTAINLGYPILLDLFNKLNDIYNFTVIKDKAGNHGVAMERNRTFIIGWRKDVFSNKVPLVEMNLQPFTSVKDIIGEYYNVPVGTNEDINHVCLPEKDRDFSNAEHLLCHIKQGQNFLDFLMENFDLYKNEITEKQADGVMRAKKKVAKGGRLWNKSPYRVPENGHAPSMSSVIQLIHPIENRHFTIREYGLLMGYPKTFIFYPEAKVDVIQAISQGVPAKYIEYIHSEIREALNGNRELQDLNGSILEFRNHISKLHRFYSLEDLNSAKKFEVTHKNEKLTK